MNLSLNIKKGDIKQIEIFWEGIFWREVPKALFFNDLVKFPPSLSWDQFILQFKALEEKIAKKQAVRLLARRSYFSTDLESKLCLKGFSPMAAKVAVLFCQERGYLDDTKEVARLIAKEQRKGLSKKAVYFKLKRQKIDEHLIQQGLSQTEYSEKQVLEKWLEKNSQKKISGQDHRKLKKFINTLMRRGFSREDVIQVLALETSKVFEEFII